MDGCHLYFSTKHWVVTTLDLGREKSHTLNEVTRGTDSGSNMQGDTHTHETKRNVK
jgi:hypothetical protein